jgi:hypothetical protein
LAAERGVISLSRQEAQRAAHQELSKHLYARERPSPLHRAAAAVLRWIGHRLDRLLAVTPGNGWGLLAIVAVVVVAGLVLRQFFGPARPALRRGPRDPSEQEMSLAELQARADRASAEQRWADAVRLRLQAVIRVLEERGVLDPRPGRTTGELVRDASAALGGHADLLARSGTTFERIWYGGRQASEADDALLRELQRALDREVTRV